MRNILQKLTWIFDSNKNNIIIIMIIAIALKVK